MKRTVVSPVRENHSDAVPAPPLRARKIGIFAGIAAISCCVYPIVLLLFGVASASEAIGLGNNLYGRWGWAFKLAGVGFAIAGIVVQLKRRGQCSVRGARASWPFLLRVGMLMVGVYCAVYAATKALATWGA
ncbi:MAG: hypothetical protein NVSMB57_16880 [Actinomycetota bacterium]